MKIKLKDGKEIELTEEVIQKVADLIIDSGDLEEPDYPYVGYSADSGGVVLLKKGQYGTMINEPTTSDSFGQESYYWSIGNFRPFTGCIHYKNGKPVKTELGGIVE